MYDRLDDFLSYYHCLVRSTSRIRAKRVYPPKHGRVAIESYLLTDRNSSDKLRPNERSE